MKQSNLLKILDILSNNNDTQIYNYTIPDVWNCFDYDPNKIIGLRSHELMVNPYDFYASVIRDYILPKTKKGIDYTQSLSLATNKQLPKRKYRGGDWIRESVLYSTMIRTSTSWDHDRSETLDTSNIYHMPETGSFVKMLALLPLLKKMGVDTVYMLPISKFSLKDKKGDLGSPYGVSSFTELDPNLKDPLTKEESTLDEEFGAFVEACHILDMRIVIDIIPRTNSVENDLIKDYPEWFYWIKASEYDEYRSPKIDGIPETATPTIDMMEKVYNDKDTYRHINMFQYNPKEQNEKLWNKIKHAHNLSAAIEQHFDLRIAPAFSDYINDKQPPWTDVTFFRMYEDFPKETKGFLDTTNRPPYILFDTIKANMYPGDKPNMKLWKKLADIIPSFQRRFGIDGARIDMGHALPKKLLHMIITKAKENDQDFAFIAEELQPQNADKAKDNGYNIIIGNGFVMEPRVFEGKLKEFMYESINLALPTFANGETHDTPRLAAREGGENLSKVLTILNMFMPNGVPFINSGQEVYEKQPMNTGLDCREDELYVLDPSDPFYGKLALFDKYQFHYTHERRWEIPDILDFIKPIRQKYLKAITNSNHFVPLFAVHHPNEFIGFGFYNKRKDAKENVLMVFANANVYKEHYLRVNIHELRKQSNNQEDTGKLLFSTHEGPRAFTQIFDHNTVDLHLGTGEIKIIEL
jgi:glycosidase